MKTPVEILQGAKTALQEHGWARKNFVDPVTGGLCMHGALACSTGLYQEILKSEDDGVYFPRINDAGDSYIKVLPFLERAATQRFDNGNIISVNDRIAQSADDVCAWIDDAIALAEAAS